MGVRPPPEIPYEVQSGNTSESLLSTDLEPTGIRLGLCAGPPIKGSPGVTLNDRHRVWLKPSTPKSRSSLSSPAMAHLLSVAGDRSDQGGAAEAPTLPKSSGGGVLVLVRENEKRQVAPKASELHSHVNNANGGFVDLEDVERWD